MFFFLKFRKKYKNYFIYLFIALHIYIYIYIHRTLVGRQIC